MLHSIPFGRNMKIKKGFSRDIRRCIGARWHLLFPILSFMLLSCTLSTINEEKYAQYTAGHFDFYYNEQEYSLQEIQDNAARKERFLVYLDSVLDIRYEGTITVIMDAAGGTSVAYVDWKGTDHESRSYTWDDLGHEIVHVISYELWGWPQSDFLIEGLAEALQLEFEHTSAIEAFLRYQHTLDSLQGDGNPATHEHCPLSPFTQIQDDAFNHSYQSYLLAGAFMKYLMVKFGMEKVKAFYQGSSDYDPAGHTALFQRIFNRRLVDVSNELVGMYGCHKD
jgi:hypothetical protein